jgi:hypothetical protein
VQHIAAAFELVAGDAYIGKENGDRAENACRLVIACFKEVGERELGELAGSRSDEVNQQQSQPSPGGLPQGGKAVAVGIFRSGKERSCSNPRGKEGEYEDCCRQRAPGNEIVGLGFDQRSAKERNAHEHDSDDHKQNDVKRRHGQISLTEKELWIARSVTDEEELSYSAGIFRAARTLSELIPPSKNALFFEDSPETSSIEDLGIPRVLARKAMSASLARPSIGGA